MSEVMNVAEPETPAVQDQSVDWDRAANVLLFGVVAHLVVAVLLAFTSADRYDYAVYGAGAFPPLGAQLLLVLAGLATIYGATGKLCDRNLKLSAYILLVMPIFEKAAIAFDGHMDEYMLLVLGEMLATGLAPAALFVVVSVRHRTLMNQSPVLAVAGLLISIPFFASARVLTQLGIGTPGSAVAHGLGALAPTTLLMAGLLVALAQDKAHLLSLLRSALILISTAAAGSLAVSLLSSGNDRYRFVIASPLPRSLLVLTVLAALLAATGSFKRPRQLAAPISIGWTIVSAIIFWPIGIVAVSLAARSLADVESNQANAERLANQARTWRLSAVVVGLSIVGLALLGST